MSAIAQPSGFGDGRAMWTPEARPLAHSDSLHGCPPRTRGTARGARVFLCQTQDIKSADSPRNARGERVEGKATGREAKSLELNKLLAAALHELGKHALAANVSGCHRDFRGWRCKPHDHRWARPITSCRFRLCAFEMRSRSMRMIHRFRKKFDELQSAGRGRYAVLSERSCDLYDLAGAVENLFKSFERLRHRVIWSRNVTGCVAVLEVTYNEKTNTWHPHLNVMWEGEYIPQAALLKAWVSCSRGRALTASGKASGVFLAQVIDLPELFKYVTKLAPIVGRSELVDVFMRATHRVKLVRCYGSFYDLAVEDEDGEDNAACCPDCGSMEIESTGRVYLEQLSLDFRGILRVDCEETDAIPPARAGPQAVISEEKFNLQYEHPRLFADAAD